MVLKKSNLNSYIINVRYNLLLYIFSLVCWFLCSILWTHCSHSRIYTAGGQPYLGNFNDKVTFPVSRGTPMISPMVKWDHSTAWFTPVAKPSDSFNGSVVINLSKSDYSHLLSNEVDGKIIMPGMTYVVRYAVLSLFNISEFRYRRLRYNVFRVFIMCNDWYVQLYMYSDVYYTTLLKFK